MAVDVDKLIEELSNMSVLDLVKLSKALQDQWGVSAAPAMVTAAPGAAAPAAGEAPAAVEEQTEFTVTLAEVGPNKINVIKAVREVVPGLGLKEAKAVVDEAPKAVKEAVTKEEAESIRAKLADAGATVEIK